MLKIIHNVSIKFPLKLIDNLRCGQQKIGTKASNAKYDRQKNFQKALKNKKKMKIDLE